MVTSYINVSAGSQWTSIFENTNLDLGQTDLRAHILLDSFLNETFPGGNVESESTPIFSQTISHLKTQALEQQPYVDPTIVYRTSSSNPGIVSQNTFQTGNMTVTGNIGSEPGSILVIEGNLTFNHRANQRTYLDGTVIVGGNLVLNSHENVVRGTVYVAGSVTVRNDGTPVNFDTPLSERPAFIFAEGDISIGNHLQGFGYLMGDTISTGNSAQVAYTGGAYYYDRMNLGNNTNINEVMEGYFDNISVNQWGLPDQVSSVQLDDGNALIISTRPQIE